jgi:phage/plasmid primase-like uncharacterized protein
MIPADYVTSARARRIEDVIAERGIKLRGRIERVGPCPRCGGRDRFAINLTKQVFNCRGCGARGGDAIALVQFLDDCNFAEACRTLTGKDFEATSKPRDNRRSNPKRDDDYEHKQRTNARRMWRMSKPAIGTPVETYLRNARGIAPPYPATVRSLPAQKREHNPAMLVPCGLPDEPEPGSLSINEKQISAVQLTLLRADGTGKAEIQPNKITIASPANMPMVLAPMNDLLGLAITEGVEDALSVHRATGLGAWASGGAAFMPKLVAAIENLAAREYDASPECVTIYAHDDDSGQRYARELADALAARGIEIFIEGIPP